MANQLIVKVVSISLRLMSITWLGSGGYWIWRFDDEVKETCSVVIVTSHFLFSSSFPRSVVVRSPPFSYLIIPATMIALLNIVKSHQCLLLTFRRPWTRRWFAISPPDIGISSAWPLSTSTVRKGRRFLLSPLSSHGVSFSMVSVILNFTNTWKKELTRVTYANQTSTKSWQQFLQRSLNRKMLQRLM